MHRGDSCFCFNLYCCCSLFKLPIPIRMKAGEISDCTYKYQQAKEKGGGVYTKIRISRSDLYPAYLNESLVYVTKSAINQVQKRASVL